jgi:hypothetical protein
MLLAAVLLPLSAACTDATRTVAPPEDPPPPASPPAFPALSRAGQIYLGAEGMYRYSDSYHYGRLHSRFVLYQDGTFALQFVSPRWGFFEYPGRYARADSRIALTFQEWGWVATGTVLGDRMTVTYNSTMSLADFEDGDYIRVPPAP